MKLSPQQLQLMRMLQMPIAALEQNVKEEIERNPLLEVDTSSPDMESLSTPEIEPDNDKYTALHDDDDDDYAYRTRLQSDPNPTQHDLIVSTEPTLSQTLDEQLGQLHLTDRQLAIARTVVGNLDDNGYLSRDTGLIANDIAFRQGIEASPSEVEEALAIVQSLEPAGIGARNLQECLSLQLHRTGMDNGSTRHAASIIDLCYNDFIHNRLDQVGTKLGLSAEQLEAAIAVIRRLNPKPGAADDTADTPPQAVFPDVTVVRQGQQLSYVINDRHLPQLRISPYYAALRQTLESGTSLNPSERDTLRFLRDKSAEATGYIGLLGQRHSTLAALMDFLIAHQRNYFLSGDTADLLPLRQTDIAEALGMDVSTISRVLNSKYTQTEFGTIALSSLCPAAFTTPSGDEVSIEAVRQAMTAIVEAEDPTNPLTDEAIANRMAQAGYPVARRTVAKYRDLWNILPARLRRRLKVLLLPLILAASTVALPAQNTTTSHNPDRAPMSYYDSIIYRRIETGKTKADNHKHMENATARADKAKPKAEPAKPAATSHVTAAADSAATTLPSHLWYGSAFSDHRVKAETLAMSSLPDEVILRLAKDSSDFCFPVLGAKTSPYGWRWERPHRGVDIQLRTGDPVRCAFSGVVRVAKVMGGYGNCIVVRHYNGLETVYGHLSKINVKRHQHVCAGDTIGLGGSSGRSTGPHLHFEVRFQYEPFDPEWILNFDTYGLRTRRLHLDKTYFGIYKPHKGENREYKADHSIIKERRRPNQPQYTEKDF
ncbi:MAG: RNA polymerase factor sigma-54 [Bacteroidales bacterium]|nr:RNA polymerase factor sigma-54 [Bacteroidales bacterium]